jgi:hypothetical protein
MKFEKYIEEGKEAKFIKAIKGAVSMAQARRYKELFHQMDMTDKERKKVQKALDKKLKEVETKRA